MRDNGKTGVARLEGIITGRRKSVLARKEGCSLLIRVLLIALIGYLVFTYGFLFTQNSGQGMFPAMKDGDLCIIFRRQAGELLGTRPQQNDIVAYQADGKRYFGRVAALSGDTVMLTLEGGVTVNGSTMSNEILFPTETRGDLKYPYVVPDGCIYVLGDYRTNTVDSRDLGAIPLGSVEGKVITILRRRGL